MKEVSDPPTERDQVYLSLTHYERSRLASENPIR
jgi:hypothetical protein